MSITSNLVVNEFTLCGMHTNKHQEDGMCRCAGLGNSDEAPATNLSSFSLPERDPSPYRVQYFRHFLVRAWIETQPQRPRTV